MDENAIAKRQTAAVAAKKQPSSLQDYMQLMAPGIEAALPSVITPERFTRIVLSAISANPQLAKCTPQSFLGAMMTSAQLGMEVNTPLGQAYLIPYNNRKKGVVECQFQLGYKGLVDLAYRSGEVTIIQAHKVCENDQFEYQLGLEPVLKHIPAAKDRGEATHYYAVFKTKDGGTGFEVMSIDDIKQHAQKFSQSYNNGPWQTNFDEMAKKTVLKRVLKLAPLKSDFVRGVMQDNTIKNELSKDMYSVPDDTVYIDEDTGEVIDAAPADVDNA